MMRSFLVLYQRDLGVETSHLLTMRLAAAGPQVPDAGSSGATSTSGSTSGSPRIGNVQAATIATNPPLGGGNPRQLAIDGREPAAGEQPQTVTQVMIGSRYFETIGLQLARGRAFDELDGTAGSRERRSSTSASSRCTFPARIRSAGAFG